MNNSDFLFNNPLETGVRSLVILYESYPVAMDLERLVEMDYLVVHSSDVADAPKSLHIDFPMRVGELLVRKELIEEGLQLMISRHLIEKQATCDGFQYQAGELSNSFVNALSTSYILELKSKAQWAVKEFASYKTSEIKQTLQPVFINNA